MHTHSDRLERWLGAEQVAWALALGDWLCEVGGTLGGASSTPTAHKWTSLPHLSQWELRLRSANVAPCRRVEMRTARGCGHRFINNQVDS